MSQLNSLEYYASRERQELFLADRAVNPAIARIHRDMAAQYAMLAREVEPISTGHAQPQHIILSAGSPPRGASTA